MDDFSSDAKDGADTWDAVAHQYHCEICDLTFLSMRGLSLHSSFSDVHLHNMQSAKLSRGNPQVEKLIYSGVKSFYWTQNQIGVRVYMSAADVRVELLNVDSFEECFTCSIKRDDVTCTIDKKSVELVADTAVSAASIGGPLNPLARTVATSHAERDAIIGAILSHIEEQKRTDGKGFAYFVDGFGVASPAIEAESNAKMLLAKWRLRHTKSGNLHEETSVGASMDEAIVEASREFKRPNGASRARRVSVESPAEIPLFQDHRMPLPQVNPQGTGSKFPKVVTAELAVAEIISGCTVTIGGFVGSAFPEDLALALRLRFQETQLPIDLTLLYGVSQGNAQGRGLDVLAHPKLIKRVVAAHSGVAKEFQRLYKLNQVEAFNLPLGQISALYRDIAAGRPGTLSTVGLGTFVDPRNGGGALNARALASKPLVHLTHLPTSEEEVLLFEAFPIHIALLRGTTADAKGNISIEDEAVVLDVLHQAMAAHNCGGRVIVQVAKLTEEAIPAKEVAIPGVFVDLVVVADLAHHWQTFASPIQDNCLAGVQRRPISSLGAMPLNERKVIARRAAQELHQGAVVNLGLGMPEGVAAVAAENGLIDGGFGCPPKQNTLPLILTAEAGIIGGTPTSGLRFGAGYNTDAILPTSALFDFYDGGGLDVTCLGMAEVDQFGNVNVGKFNNRYPGIGGFINIAYNAKKLVFLGTMTTGGLKVDANGNQLSILQEGAIRKFVSNVQQNTFSGLYAVRKRKYVTFITERCVFRLTSEGLELVEVAPGIDIDRDILSVMEFTPKIRKPLKEMDRSIFAEKGFVLDLSPVEKVPITPLYPLDFPTV